MLDETMFVKTMALSVANKTNNMLSFLYWKNKFLTSKLRGLPCKALIQSHVDCVCSAYPNLRLKDTMKVHFCKRYVLL